MVELCVRSGWTRDTIDFGPTESAQELYDPPPNFRRPADNVVTVGALDYGAADPQTARNLKRRRGQTLVGPGAWWIDHRGGLKLGIYPVPAAGLPIEMLAVVTPDPLVNPTDEPPVPWDFRPAIIQYVRQVTLGLMEDDPEIEDVGLTRFDREVGRLAALLNEVESGDGPMQVQVQGVHW